MRHNKGDGYTFFPPGNTLTLVLCLCVCVCSNALVCRLPPECPVNERIVSPVHVISVEGSHPSPTASRDCYRLQSKHDPTLTAMLTQVPWDTMLLLPSSRSYANHPSHPLTHLVLFLYSVGATGGGRTTPV